MIGRIAGQMTSISPLITFRVLFGFIMAVSLTRFFLKGWITELYVKPTYFFTFLGFDWVKPLGSIGMHLIFLVAFLGAIGIMLGLFYRLSTVLFFTSFTYIELIDKTNYLNHYYFVSLIAFLLILVPAHRAFSLDILRRPGLAVEQVPVWTINIFKAQLAIVYLFAGLAKLNADWLWEAMPLKLWLPSLSHLPIIGKFLNYEWTAFLFSWSGAVYDLTIAFFLLFAPTRKWAYLAVVAFHLMTAFLFQIGMFPYIMIFCTLIFFSAEWHQKRVDTLKRYLSWKPVEYRVWTGSRMPPVIAGLSIIYFVVQLIVPLRSSVYPGSVFWTEQGYRFSWRVMLMEKAGYTQFIVKDKNDEKSEWVNNYDYLTPQQEKMMSTQPDMILQFAHFLAAAYRAKGFNQPKVFCDSHVTFNGRQSRRFLDSSVDLAAQPRNFISKPWILPFYE